MSGAEVEAEGPASKSQARKDQSCGRGGEGSGLWRLNEQD